MKQIPRHRVQQRATPRRPSGAALRVARNEAASQRGRSAAAAPGTKTLCCACQWPLYERLIEFEGMMSRMMTMINPQSLTTSHFSARTPKRKILRLEMFFCVTFQMRFSGLRKKNFICVP